MNKETIEIHEFSTGIHPEKTANGGWISRGFTGQYMNMTLKSVPHAVERSIANREFAVTEGASTDQPAIIGRVVGSGEDAWSVVAVVTRGRDEIKRSLSVYRYFLCEGDNNLWKILAWWESQGKPRFNPFDSKEVRQPNLSPEPSNVTPELSDEEKNLADNTPAPILLSPQQYDLKKVNIFALRQRKNNGQPVSWAFNVEALEQPRRFQVIQAASQRAYEILDREIKNVPQVLAPVFMDEEALKSAIRGLMNSSKVKPEAVQTIADALKNEQITKEYWQSLFNGQGAQTAINQKIYSPQMVRLITLKAMIIPETITEFLEWLNFKGTKDKQDENQRISLEFQKSVRAHFPQEKLANGIKYILHKLLNKQITVESLCWLLIENDSAWVNCKEIFIEDIEYDLDIIKKKYYKSKFSYESLKCDQDIWNKLIKDFKTDYSPVNCIEYYKPLAELFEYMEEYDLSAYFYQVSQGQVPKDIFDEVAYQKNIYDKDLNVLGLKVKPKEFIVPIQIVMILSALMFSSGLFVGYRFIYQQGSSEKKNIENVAVENTTPSKPDSASSSIQIPENTLKKGVQDFKTTSKSIQTLVSKLEAEVYSTRLTEALKNVLNDKNLDYEVAIKNVEKIPKSPLFLLAKLALIVLKDILSIKIP